MTDKGNGMREALSELLDRLNVGSSARVRARVRPKPTLKTKPNLIRRLIGNFGG